MASYQYWLKKYEALGVEVLINPMPSMIAPSAESQHCGGCNLCGDADSFNRASAEETIKDGKEFLRKLAEAYGLAHLL